MGSHGGGTAEGQVQLLTSLGITEQSVGAPIISSIEVDEIGQTNFGMPVYIGRDFCRAYHVAVINRVKPHNAFVGRVESGLANVVEKSLGSIAKSGDSQLADVIGPGERIRKKGLTFAATPASDFICGTLQLAAGMNLEIFTTGRGTPYSLAMAPVIKVATRSNLSKRWFDLIDVDAGRIVSGEASIEDIGWELFQLILDVASARKQAAADRLGLQNDLVLFNPGPVT